MEVSHKRVEERTVQSEHIAQRFREVGAYAAAVRHKRVEGLLELMVFQNRILSSCIAVKSVHSAFDGRSKVYKNSRVPYTALDALKLSFMTFA